MKLLDGIRILSLNHFIFGPYAVQHLADLGADVIMVEPPQGIFHRRFGGADRRADGESVGFLCANRNKRMLALNLKSDEGRQIVLELAERADVFCENFRPGVLDRLGLGYQAVRAVNRSIVYASATGWGATGPYLGRPGQDLLVQAVSGFAAVNGQASDPARAIGVSGVDHHGASLLAMGILAALLNRARTGEGRRVEVDLLSSALDLQNESLVAYLNGPRQESVTSADSMAGWIFPGPYGIYAGADGHVALSLCQLVDLAAVLDEPRLADIPQDEAYPRRAEIADLVRDAVRPRAVLELCAALEERKVWHARVQDYEEVLADPQVAHNGSILEVEGAGGSPVGLLGHPVTFDGERPGVRLPPQRTGAQTAEILRELGYDQAAIDDLAGRGIATLGG